MGLYVEDKNKEKFTTRIKSIIENNNGNFLVLDKSFFNPSYFLMPSDKGHINGEKVLKVIVKEGIVMHLVNSYSRFTINMQVSCEIDMKNRLDYIIQDTAYHLLKFIINDKFNVNASLISVDSRESVIYINSKLKDKDVFKIESLCNDYIKKDFEIMKKNEMKKNILHQYIKIHNFNYEECPYVHVDSLKEIQIIKIKNIQDFNEGIKISFIAGERVFKFLRERDLIIKSLENECGGFLDEIAFKVRLLKEKSDINENKYEVLLDETSSYIAESFNKDYIIEDTVWSEDLIKKVGEILSKDHIIAAFYNEETFKSFIFVNQSINIKDIVDNIGSRNSTTNYPKKILSKDYAEITFENNLNLKRFVSDIYDKMLKYNKI